MDKTNPSTHSIDVEITSKENAITVRDTAVESLDFLGFTRTEIYKQKILENNLEVIYSPEELSTIAQAIRHNQEIHQKLDVLPNITTEFVKNYFKTNGKIPPLDISLMIENEIKGLRIDNIHEESSSTSLFQEQLISIGMSFSKNITSLTFIKDYLKNRIPQLRRSTFLDVSTRNISTIDIPENQSKEVINIVENIVPKELRLRVENIKYRIRNNSYNFLDSTANTLENIGYDRDTQIFGIYSLADSTLYLETLGSFTSTPNIYGLIHECSHSAYLSFLSNPELFAEYLSIEPKGVNSVTNYVENVLTEDKQKELEYKYRERFAEINTLITMAPSEIINLSPEMQLWIEKYVLKVFGPDYSLENEVNKRINFIAEIKGVSAEQVREEWLQFIQSQKV